MVNEKIKNNINNLLLGWFRKNARDLPWRQTRDPYAIWVSEIMLQQTRVETVIPYYQRWLAEFPTVESLAEAEEDQVLMIWEGLGYYNRARNLQAAAKIVKEKYQGKLPADQEALESLPGIGRYTAGAILSIAFNQPAPILDGNLRRVLTRLFNIDTPIQTSETENALWKIAESLLPKSNPGDFNQALMELGALVCLPKSPLCDSCPLANDCQANQLGLQDDLPLRKEKTPIPHLQVTAGVIPKGGNVLIAKRPPGGLLGGLWEFPGGKQKENETLEETLARELMEELNLEVEIGELVGIYQHAYTHYQITLHAFRCRMVSEDIQLKYHTDSAWVPLEELSSYPMGKIDRLIADQMRSI